jgi:hypothetical protein
VDLALEKNIELMYKLTEQHRQHLMMRPTECFDQRLSIQDKIKSAQNLYLLWKDALRQQSQINNLLADWERCRRVSRESMLELRIVEICKRCDEEEGGSCCGAGMENKFDTFLLLVNLLLRVTLPERHLRTDSCYFLTDKGCILKVRLVLCVDFLCDKILNALRVEKLLSLQKISGEELVTGFRLYDAIKKFLRHKDPAEAMLSPENASIADV